MTRIALLAALVSFSWVALADEGERIPQGEAPLKPEDAPPALRPWIEWALDGHREYGCAWDEGDRRCEFPGELRLDVASNEARFSVEVERLASGRFELPGSASRWPEDVLVDGRAAPVLSRSGAPVVWLAAGSHRVEGRLVYPEMPESIAVPRAIALISLTIGGEPVATPRRRADGALWFDSEGAGRDAEESLSLQVHRRVEDGVPLRVVTRIVLDAAGLARQVELGEALIEGSVPVSLSADLPARLEPDGSLTVQISAGRHEVEIVARVDASTDTLARPAAGPRWPSEEIWVFRADDELRQAEVTGADFVDPSRTKLPQDFLGLPAYAVGRGGGLTLVTLRRGIERTPPDALSLSRTLWLDLDGDGYSVRDRISGVLRGSHRLDLLAGDLGRVAIDGDDQLITSDGEATGVEIRRAELEMLADLRLEEARSRVPAVGWSEDVRSLGATLHLPPGTMLLAAAGVDRAAGAWIERWNLGAIFFVLLMTIALHRMAGPVAAAVAFGALVVTWGEPDAPRWVWLFLLVAAAVHAGVRGGRIKVAAKVAVGAASVALVLIATPFVREQIKRALHPQTAQLGGSTRFSPLPGAARDRGAPPPSQDGFDESREPEMEEAAGVSESLSVDSSVASRSSAPYGAYGAKRASLLSRDPNETVQTGPGMPSWTFTSHRLEWDGPVAADHEMRLFLVSPPVYRALSIARVLALLALAFSLLRAARGRPRAGGGAAMALLFVAAATAAPGAARAQAPAPPPELLQELERRLTRAPSCAPDCVEIGRLDLTVADGSIRGALRVSAGTDAAVRLPGPASAFVPRRVTVDGAPAGAALGADGFLRVRVPGGARRVELEGPLPDPNALKLELAELPRRVTVRAEGYHVRGLREDGRVDGTLHLDREASEGALGGDARDEQNLSPWLEVTRTLEFGVQWEVFTEVRRVSPPGSSVSLSYELLPGESVITDSVRRDGDSVELTLDRDAIHTSFRSRLAVREALTLTAAEGRAYSEVWQVRCGAIFACEPSGLAPVSLEDEGLVAPTFRPFPGDSLDLRFSRPEAAPGRATTIDSVELVVSPGIRRVASSLALTARSSRGDALSIGLPEQARVESVVARGRTQPIRFDSGTLTVRLEPGESHVVVRFQETRELGLFQSAPRVDLGGPAVNVTTTFEVPAGRLLLFTSGPSWGPAVLFWAKVFFVLLAAFLLSRLPRAPLRFGSFALLGLGLAQTSAVAALLVAGWFFAIEHRQRTADWPEVRFNTRQIVLPIYTLIVVVIVWVAIYEGLLGIPDMQVEGNGSNDRNLRFYTDRVDGALPAAAYASAPLWVYRVVMLAWALWLALSSAKWARWAFHAYREGGLFRASKGGRPGAPRRDEGGAAPASDAPGGEPGRAPSDGDD